MRKWLKIALVTVGGFLIFYFLFFPPLLDRLAHGSIDREAILRKISKESIEFHNTLTVIDLHSDALLWNRNILNANTRGHVDIPRMKKGNGAIEAFTIVSKVPIGSNLTSTPDGPDVITALSMAQKWPFYTWFSLEGRALYQAEKLHRYARESKGEFMVIHNRVELEKFLELRKVSKVIGGFIGLEGAHPISDDLSNFEKLYKAGIRMIAPTHLHDNRFAGSLHGVKKYGLTELGKKLIAKMNKKRVLLDLAHLSEKAIIDSLAIFKRPVLVSHTGIKGHCDQDRNISDAAVKAIAKNGGIIGLGMFSAAICTADVESFVEAVAYLKNTIGVKHIALGADFDGFVLNFIDSSTFALITHALLNDSKNRFTKENIRLIMGKNALRVIRANL